MKIALISGLCVKHDAISTAVLHQRRVLIDAGHEVKVFVHFSDVLGGDHVVQCSSSWSLQAHSFYATSDVVILHFGIMYELFDVLLLPHDTAIRVVHFHNVTPPELLSGPARQAAELGLKQLSIVDRADVFWSDSEHNADSLVEIADVRRSSIRHLPLHVPIVDDPPRRVPTARDVALYVGRFVPAKGIHDVIAAFAKTKLSSPAELWLAGSKNYSDPRYLVALHNLTCELGIDSNVRFLHDLAEHELRELYGQAAVFVTGSYHEGFCVPVVEALASGCRVVATAAGALPDTVNGFGEVVDTGDVAALAEALTTQLRLGPLDERVQAERKVCLAEFGAAVSGRRLLSELARARQRTSLGAARSPSERQRYAERQRRLIDVLRCPKCHASLSIEHRITSRHAVVAGLFRCQEHGFVGQIDAFKPDFVSEVQQVRDSRAARYVLRTLDLYDNVVRSGDWTITHLGLTAVDPGQASLSFPGGDGGFRLILKGHAPHRRVHLTLDSRRPIPIEMTETETEVEITEGCETVTLTAGSSPDPLTPSALTVSAIATYVEPEEVPVPGVTTRNRGNPYPEAFSKLLAEQLPHALVLDCGGGDRRFGDDRIVNLEYLGFELPDIFCDGLALPFADDSFDLVLSQAVLEHVPDPQRAVDEFVRVLKPGGLAYVEIAYMQPLHAVPYHFMNVTPHGIAHLCRELETVDAGVFGGLQMTFGWFVDLIGARVKVGDLRIDNMLQTLAEIDDKMSQEELASVASAVYLLGRKRTPLSA